VTVYDHLKKVELFRKKPVIEIVSFETFETFKPSGSDPKGEVYYTHVITNSSGVTEQV